MSNTNSIPSLDQSTINLFIEQSHDIFMRFDINLRHTFVSKTISRLFQLNPEDMLYKTHEELNFDKASCKFWKERITNVFKSTEPSRFEYLANTIYGKRTFLWKLFPEKDNQNKVVSVLSLAKDITPYKKAKIKYNNIFNEMPEGYALHEIITNKDNQPIDYVFLEVNPAFEKLTGLRAQDIIGKRILSVLPNIEQQLIDNYGKVALNGERLQFKYYSTELDRYYEISSFQSEPGFFITIFKDITEESKAKQLHQSIVKSISDCLVIIEQDYSISWANKKSKNLFGENIEGQKCYKVYHNLDKPCNECLIFKLLSNKNDLDETDQLEYIIKTEKGEKIFLKKAVKLFNHSNNINDYSILEISKDITEYKINQKKLAHSEKMMAVGQLAGGIAHDFNNMLMAIQGFVNFARDSMDKNSPEYRFLTRALQASDRSASLVKQILAFSRQSKHENQSIFILPIIKEALNLLDMSLTSGIQIDRKFHPEKNTIDGNPTTIHEIIVNLCTNAAHSMNMKGTIFVSHEEKKINKHLSLYSGTIKSGTYSIIKISDSGHGISKEIIQKIFEPFFTTKSQSEGTGMGLSVVLGIIKNYGGEIDVQSEQNKGTTFTVYLPKSNNPEFIEKNKEIHKAKNSEHLLVIDDEEYLLETLELMLKKLGYTVTSYTNPQQAIKDLINNRDKYSCLITDNIMPEINGLEIIKTARDNNINIPAIVCTGFSSKFDSKMLKELNICKLLLKPFTLESISESVSKAIHN